MVVVVVVVSVNMGVGMGIEAKGCVVGMGKTGGMDTGIDTDGGEGGVEWTETSGVGERGGVSPRPEASSSELSLSDSEGGAFLCLGGTYSESESLEDWSISLLAGFFCFFS